MDEPEIRRVAEAARALLSRMVPDATEAARVEAAIGAALALPPGSARNALLRALAIDPKVRAWSRAQLNTERRYRSLDQRRHLVARAPEQVAAGSRFPIQVYVARRAPGSGTSAPMDLDVPPDGVDVSIAVWAPGLVAEGDLEQDVHIPADGDSAMVRFSFTAVHDGPQTVQVDVYRGGTHVGGMVLQIAVGAGAATAESSVHEPLTDVRLEDGEVTLRIARQDDDRYSYRLIGPGAEVVEPSERVAAEPRDEVAALVAQLDEMARGVGPHRDPADQLSRLENLGANLWNTLPPKIRQHFWELGKIGCLTIDSDVDLPWELMYPVRETDRAGGFLVDRMPVLRRVRGQDRVRTLKVVNSAYVAPRGAPTTAPGEIAEVRALLGAGVADLGRIQILRDLRALIETPPSVLHFTCHNEFDRTTGSVITLDDGPFTPVDLSKAVAGRYLTAATPLVFLNACRSAGEIPALNRPMSWAGQFMAAGAGVFLGSLWAVRSKSAQQFAAAFYGAFVTRNLALAQATFEARQEIRALAGDPTWLAYTVYGNPSAALADKPGGGT